MLKALHVHCQRKPCKTASKTFWDKYIGYYIWFSTWNPKLVYESRGLNATLLTAWLKRYFCSSKDCGLLFWYGKKAKSSICETGPELHIVYRDPRFKSQLHASQIERLEKILVRRHWRGSVSQRRPWINDLKFNHLLNHSKTQSLPKLVEDSHTQQVNWGRNPIQHSSAYAALPIFI